MRAVVDTQWSVLKPTITTLLTPAARRRASRSVPMKELLTLLTITGSPASGSPSGLCA